MYKVNLSPLCIIGALFLATSAEAKLKVVCTNPTIAALAKEVGGVRVEVMSLTNIDEDPHRAKVSASLSVLFDEADLLLYNGAREEAGWLPALIKASGNASIQKGETGEFDLSLVANLLPGEPSSLHTKADPHYLLSPVEAQGVAFSIAARLSVLANKDRNSTLRVAYWATGDGSQIEVVGELTGAQAKEYKFPGPKYFGKGTVMLPAIRDYVAYIREQVKTGARRGLAVIITDSQLYDAEDIKAYSAKVAEGITEGKLPPINFVFVGVGDQVDEEQMEQISHEEFPGVGHLWCHRIADRMEEMAELVAMLVDRSMIVADTGTITDDKGNIIKRYEGGLPAVLEFEVPPDAKSFTLEINGEKFTQPLHGLEEEDHHE
jgi:hypothetical protein